MCSLEDILNYNFSCKYAFIIQLRVLIQYSSEQNVQK